MVSDAMRPVLSEWVRGERDFVSCCELNKNETWIDVKLVFLKHFLNESYVRLVETREKVVRFKEMIIDLEREFESLILATPIDTLNSSSPDRETLREKIDEIRFIQEEFQLSNAIFHEMINEHPLLASYANIFVILYTSMKMYSKLTEEPTYSWRVYLKIIDLMIGKIMRDLSLNQQEESEEEGEGEVKEAYSADQKPKKRRKQREFTVDEDFFH